MGLINYINRYYHYYYCGCILHFLPSQSPPPHQHYPPPVRCRRGGGGGRKLSEITDHPWMKHIKVIVSGWIAKAELYFYLLLYIFIIIIAHWIPLHCIWTPFPSRTTDGIHMRRILCAWNWSPGTVKGIYTSELNIVSESAVSRIMCCAWKVH